MPPDSPFDITRLVDRPIWLITAAAKRRRGGLVATWVMPASLDAARPVLLVAFGPNHFTAELVQERGAFAAHLLRSDQAAFAWNFARDSGRQRDKLLGFESRVGITGAPILTDCLAWCECRVGSRYRTGDRVLTWGDVVDGGNVAASTQAALSEKTFFSNLTDEQQQILAAQQRADAALLRPLHDQWRRSVQP